jgi:protein arginine N-methyltransferase 1
MGFFAVLACQMGARSVIAIEPDNVIEIARRVATANQCADKIRFIHDFSLQAELAERVDIIISDLRGVLPWFERHLPALIDARKRLLAPEGTLIPARDMVWAALVESPELYASFLEPWCSKPSGVDLSVARPFAVNRWIKGRSCPVSQFLGLPQRWTTLDYAVIEDVNLSSTVSWTVPRSGLAHGFLLWFDAELGDGIRFSNHPAEPQLIYGNAFFPLSTPLELSPGEVVSVDLRATLVGADYVWAWKTTVSAGDPPQAKTELNQSTFFGCPLSPEHVATRAENYIASLSEDGLIDRTVLDLMDGKMTLGQISERLREKFPSRFSTVHEALARVGGLSERYSRPSKPI